MLPHLPRGLTRTVEQAESLSPRLSPRSFPGLTCSLGDEPQIKGEERVSCRAIGNTFQPFSDYPTHFGEFDLLGTHEEGPKRR